MDGIVLELQREALSSNGDILSLLRKAYLIAKKLTLTDFEEWITCELKGYAVPHSIPQYRLLRGKVEALNPYRGWIPVIFNANESNLSIYEARDSIANILDVYNKSTSGFVVVDFPDSINSFLNEHGSAPFLAKYHLQLSASQLFSIIESVRTSILDWALALESNGIMGENLHFSEDEKEIATKSPTICNYITNVYGNVSNSQFQQGTTNSEQA